MKGKNHGIEKQTKYVLKNDRQNGLNYVNIRCAEVIRIFISNFSYLSLIEFEKTTFIPR